MMEKQELKDISKLFIDYDGDVQINPFAKVHWGMIKDSLKDNNLYIDDNKNFGIIIISLSIISSIFLLFANPKP